MISLPSSQNENYEALEEKLSNLEDKLFRVLEELTDKLEEVAMHHEEEKENMRKHIESVEGIVQSQHVEYEKRLKEAGADNEDS